MGSRGRITVPDVVYTTATLAFVGALAPVFYDGLDANAGQLGTGEAFLFQLIGPLLALVLMSVIWFKATRGVS
ncbi:hypothetical protein C5B90_06410 [Haloferax sp. Atlit-12N]|nr:hypothetical protein C5B90_06410 [Haloferax sp. Atlit-12N]